jgi:hypothetical protein
VANPPGTSNAEGAALSLARSDHTHALAAFGSSAGTFAEGDDSRLSDDRTADGLRTATTVVSISAAAAPSSGQVLKATSSTTATWQADAGGGVSAAQHDTLDSQTIFSTSSTSFVDGFAGGVIEPPADGDYMITFEGEISGSAGNTVVEIGIGLNSTTVAQTGSERQAGPSGAGLIVSFVSTLVLTGLTAAGSDISGIIRKVSGGGSAEVQNRRITMTRVTT